MKHEDAIRAVGLKPGNATVDDTPHGAVVTDGNGHQVLVDEAGKLWWYGTAPNAGLPLFQVQPAVDLAEVVESPVEPERPAIDDDPMPGSDATAKAMLDWVNKVSDKVAERAAQALAAEQDREPPRSTLVRDLEKLAVA